MHWSFRKCWFNDLWDLPNVDTFHYTVSKNYIHYHYWSQKKISLVLHWMVDRNFWNSDFCLQVWILSLATNTVSCLLWNDGHALFIFKKMTAKYSTLNKLCLWIILPSKNGIPCTNVARSACTWNHCTSASPCSSSLFSAF